MLNRYGLNANAFANYNGAPVTRDDQAGVLSTAASLVASGNQEAAANLLKMYGLDSNAAGSYGTIANRQLATQLAKAAATKSSGSSRSSGGNSGNNNEPSIKLNGSQILSYKKERDAIAKNGGDTSWYDAILAANGAAVSNSTQTVENTGTGGSDTGTLLAQRYAKRGYSAWAITNIMSQNGYSDKEISDALEKAGVE